jgi:hypothetical protein
MAPRFCCGILGIELDRKENVLAWEGRDPFPRLAAGSIREVERSFARDSMAPP